MENRYLPVVRKPGREQRRSERVKARLYLLPATLLYTTYAVTMLFVAFRSAHPVAGPLWFVTGLLLWTPLEYLVHRHVLHGNFPPSGNPLRELLHRAFDETHVEHHRKPLAARHLSGSLRARPRVVLLGTSRPRGIQPCHRSAPDVILNGRRDPRELAPA